MRLSLIIAAVVYGSALINGECPHERNGLMTWSSNFNVNADESVMITEPIIVDVATVSVRNVVIQDGGMLTFSPDVDIDFRTHNIYIYKDGAMEIGSEECPYTGKLSITITGNREEHQGETNPKAILVDEGGTLEVHGEPRLSWTKISETQKPPSQNNEDIYFEHEWESEYNTVDTWINGVVAYTFILDGTNTPTVKKFGAYELKWHNQKLVDHINDVQDGEILMMASQREIRRDEGDQQIPDAYDALETLVHGEVTGDGVLRGVQKDGSTWAFVYQKGNSDSYQEVTNPLGTTSLARFVLNEDMIFSAWTVGGDRTWKQQENFRISNRNGIQPKLRLIDDTTSWQAGDKIVIASTDYDWLQAEVREIVFCTDCENNEIRINDFFTYMHYGDVLHGAVDMRAEVALLSRKLVIKGEMEAECPEFNENCNDKYVDGLDTFGAHIKILKGYANVHLEHFELFNVGQQTDAGRYPIHFHMCFEKVPNATTPYIRGVSIHDTFARCVTIHGSHGVEVIDSTCYKHMGHGFFLEDGGELDNTFDGNLAILTLRATGSLEPIDAAIPASFWITNPNTRVKNNVAAGGFGAGIWFIYPELPLPPSREYNLMAQNEAMRTMIKEFDNNVAHSNHVFGIMIGNRLEDDRTTHCCNDWQPLEDPKDPESAPIEINLRKITAYKNRMHNVWIEGGLLNVQNISVSDSSNGLLITNEGQQFDGFTGKLSNAVVIGDSDNVGEPSEGHDRSLPYPWTPEFVRSGVTLWKGPTAFSNVWFDGFQSNSIYDTAAFAKKRNSPYFFSVNTPLRNVEFAFSDGAGLGTIALTGTEGVNPGWKNRDGEKISGFTWFRETDTGQEETLYVVKPDHLSAAAVDCALRPNWRLAICKTKYGNVRLRGDMSQTHVVFVRDDLPSAQLDMEMKTTTGPQVVLDGSRTYTMHSTEKGSSFTIIVAEGIEIGDTLRVGFCTPIGAEIELFSLFPVRLSRKEFFVRVNSLAELDAEDENDGKKYFHDETTGMVYYKFIGATNRTQDQANSCGGGQCPEFRVRIMNGDLNDMDCRSRLYTAEELSMEKPPLPEYTEIIPAGSSTPPAGYGAGYTRPFTNREVIDGGYSDWTEWSACSKTCDEGVKYRTRACNQPVPANGGKSCEGDSQEAASCLLEPCAIDGGLSAWSEWSTCTRYDSQYCAGSSERTRSCSEPAAQYGGDFCEGSLLEVKSCTACNDN